MIRFSASFSVTSMSEMMLVYFYCSSLRMLSLNSNLSDFGSFAFRSVSTYWIVYLVPAASTGALQMKLMPSSAIL